MPDVRPEIKAPGIIRAGFEYQDLVGIEVLIDHFRDPDLYDWVELESEDKKIQALDDVVAMRKDGSVEYLQVKFTVDPYRYPLDWDWLLASKGSGSTMLSKWCASFFRAKSHGQIHKAELRTNRIASNEFSKCLEENRLVLDKVPSNSSNKMSQTLP